MIRWVGWALYWRARAIVRLYRHATWPERAALPERAEAGALLEAASFHAVLAHGSIDHYRSGERANASGRPRDTAPGSASG